MITARVLPGSLVRSHENIETWKTMAWGMLDESEGPGGALKRVFSDSKELVRVISVVTAREGPEERYPMCEFAFIMTRVGSGWIPTRDLEVVT